MAAYGIMDTNYLVALFAKIEARNIFRGVITNTPQLGDILVVESITDRESGAIGKTIAGWNKRTERGLSLLLKDLEIVNGDYALGFAPHSVTIEENNYRKLATYIHENNFHGNEKMNSLLSTYLVKYTALRYLQTHASELERKGHDVQAHINNVKLEIAQTIWDIGSILHGMPYVSLH